MKIGRNEPCPCGSGKKYKKCCLAKDEEAARRAREAAAAEASARAAAPGEPPPPEDPLHEEKLALWDDLGAVEYEEKIELLESSLLHTPELIDGETVIDTYGEIFAEAARRGERDRFDRLVGELRRVSPEAYDNQAAVLLGWQLTNALVAGRDAEARDLALEFAAIPTRSFNLFDEAVDQACFHGRQALALEMSRKAWPQIRKAEKIADWAILKFGHHSASLTLFEALDGGWLPAQGWDALLASVRQFTGVNLERYQTCMTHVSGQGQRLWSAADLEYPASTCKADEQDEDDPERERWGLNLTDLSGDFLNHLRRECGIPYCRGELGRSNLVDYLTERGDEEVRRKRARVEPGDVLCPDGATLNKFGAELTDPFSPCEYQAAALMSVIPPWLRFLESLGLISASQRKRSLISTKGVAEALHLMWHDGPQGDPALAETVTSWGE